MRFNRDRKKKLTSDFHMVIVFCLIGLLLTLCGTLLFPELGALALLLIRDETRRIAANIAKLPDTAYHHTRHPRCLT
jgi:hypothetical protein